MIVNKPMKYYQTRYQKQRQKGLSKPHFFPPHALIPSHTRTRCAAQTEDIPKAAVADAEYHTSERMDERTDYLRVAVNVKEH